MPNLKFTKSDYMKSYHDLPKDWENGDVREVDDVTAERLLNDFPDNFSKTNERSNESKAVNAPGSNKAVDFKGHNK